MSKYWPAVKNSTLPVATKLKATLIISLRNEVDNIPKLSTAIKGLPYPYLEVILMDDHSEDQTWQVLNKSFEGLESIKILKNPGIGKKSAINHAISISDGEVILTSDADCYWESSWIEEMLQSFENPNINLVAGPVLSQQKEGFLSGFQLMEWASILLVTNFGFAFHKPVTCSAANLAYRKSAYEKVNGFQGNENNPSGDDEFLLKKIIAEFGAESVFYKPFQENLILTQPESSWKDLIYQKIRWAGKWKSHDSKSHVVFALVPFILQLIWLSSFSLLFQGKLGYLSFSLLWSFKILAESLAFGRILRSLENPFRLSDLIVTSFIHPFYVVGIGIGIVRGKYLWKGRENGRSV
jgi:cellulose synthase/poly-beta-1,6-N-acetylglucosamine synthase-like glycosyltransferase